MLSISEDIILELIGDLNTLIFITENDKKVLETVTNRSWGNRAPKLRLEAVAIFETKLRQYKERIYYLENLLKTTKEKAT